MYSEQGRVAVFAILSGVILVGFICFITGITLIVSSNNAAAQGRVAQSKSTYSIEANRIGLEEVLQKVLRRYFELYHNRIASKPGVTADEVKRIYKPLDQKPEIIKYRTDESRKLLRELESIQVDMDKLRPFEQRAIYQIKYWVKHNFAFGVPNGYDYYSGDWMMGPDIFCWSPICQALPELAIHMNFFKPVTTQDLELVKVKLQEAGQGFVTEVSNMKLGVKAGMVRNIEACQSGLDSIQTVYRAVQHNPKGILNDTTVKKLLNGFISNMRADQANEWKARYGKTVSESLDEYLIEYLGKPIHEMLRYVEFNLTQHCVSSDISSGMGSLPLKTIYINNNPAGQTTGQLPTGEKLDGLETYKKILAYFTSTDITADEIYNSGKKIVDKIYSELLKEARKITGESDDERAKTKILEELNKDSNFFNDQPIPPEESDKNAHSKCISMETAKIHCPNRWKAMNRYFSYVKELFTVLQFKILNLFHFVGRKSSVPSCPVEPVANFNPSAPAAVYFSSDINCTRTAKYFIPFFLKRVGPKSDEWTVSAHEMIPGHHLQVQGYFEKFLHDTEGVMQWLCSDVYYLTFAEGWALYAEGDLVVYETDAYKDFPLMKFGALRFKVLRAVRLMIEIGLHTRGMKREEALKMMASYTWGDSDRMAKEITRYQSVPAQSVTYELGRTAIMQLRQEAEKKLGNKFNIKDFHYQLLRHGGPATLPYLERAIKKYINCELDKNEFGCDEMLSPPAMLGSGNSPSLYRNMWPMFRVN